jgi:thiol:disulfide interchange protein DsbD
MKTIFFWLFSLILLCGEPLNFDNAFKIDAKFIKDSGAVLSFNIDESVYLYKDKFKLTISSNLINDELNLPPTKTYKDHEIYSGQFQILIPQGLIKDLSNIDKFDIKLSLSGCSIDGFCYPPKNFKFDFFRGFSDYKITKTELKNSNLQHQAQRKEAKIAGFFENKNIFWIFAIFFGYGLLMSLTPCVFPMIPILSSILAFKIAKNPNGEKSKQISIKTMLFLSLIYVLSMAFAYALIGAITGLFGFNLNTAFQNPLVSAVISALFVFFALNMFGVFEINLPSGFQNKISDKLQQKGGIFAVIFMGMLSALIVGPCIVAPMAGALIYIANTGDWLIGFFTLFFMGLGMGVPLLAIGTGFGLPRPGAWMGEIRMIFGFLMLFSAVYFSDWVIGKNLALLFYGIIGVFFAVFLWGSNRLKQGFSLVIFIYSVILIIGFAIGGVKPFKPLQNLGSTNALQSNFNAKLNFKYVSNLGDLNTVLKTSTKPVLLDFWASWCVSCEEFDEILSGVNLDKFELIRVDMTAQDEKISEILTKFGVLNPPTILFFKNGEEIQSARIVGLVEKSYLNATIDDVK